MTELRNNLNMGSKKYFENDLVTWLVQLDEQRIQKEDQIWWEERRKSAITGSVCMC